MNFVKQYEKIQTHVLVREGGNDYRTDHLEVELWSDFPIKKQAYAAYTRDIYLKFRTEFELIGKYNAVRMVLVCLSFTQTEKDGLLIMVLQAIMWQQKSKLMTTNVTVARCPKMECCVAIF